MVSYSQLSAQYEPGGPRDAGDRMVMRIVITTRTAALDKDRNLLRLPRYWQSMYRLG
jgi:hypothetical protein